MSRIDWVILTRLGSRILATLLVFYGLIALVESLDTWRFNYVADNHGLAMAVVMVAMSAVKWTIKTLPVTVLMGAILGFVDLKARHELTVIQASGMSIWRVVRAPVIALILVSLLISLGLLTPPGEVWLEQRSGDAHYVMMATGMQPGGAILGQVTLFHLGESDIARLEAPEAQLIDGKWVLPTATARAPGKPDWTVFNYSVPTESTPTEIALKLASTEDMTFFELARLLQAGVADPSIRTAGMMRLIKLLALPLVLTGSLFIAFAFTAGYRRGSNYGPAVLYGIVLGFVVFVITEMADRAGSTGVLDPTFAAIGPAFVAIVIGVTVLLYKEDGRA
jgi:lipopolysaccharide export system permease protein